MRSTFLRSIAVLGLILAGCKGDLRPITARWDELTTEWQGRAEGLEEDAARAQELAALATTRGLDPANPAARLAATLIVSTQTHKASIDHAASTLVRIRALVEASFRKGDLAMASASVETAQAEMNALLATITEEARKQREQLVALDAAISQEEEAAKLAAKELAEEAERWRRASLERTPVELTGIRFIGDTAQLEAPDTGAQRQLDQVVEWANGWCPALSFSLTGHTSRELSPKDALVLSERRALAVKKYLVEHGVPSRRIIRVEGAGALKLAAEEPASDSEAARSMNPDELETLRKLNRRITIEAVQTCPVG